MSDTGGTFVVTIDTEASAWDHIEENSIANVAGIPPLQDLFDSHGVRPTYLVTYEMATRDEAVRILAPLHDSGRCEIGHHLHVWTTPPFERPNRHGVDMAWLHAFQSELPDDLFVAKAETLRRAIGDAYGQLPTSHRAGRWGIDLRTFQWLHARGFIVDTSMTPGVSHADIPGARGHYGIDTSRVEARPFVQDLTPPFRPAARATDGIVEVPVSAKRLPQRGLGRLAELALPAGLPWSNVGRRVLSRVLPTPLRSIPCRPVPSFREEDLLRVAEAALEDAGIVNLMFHSSEVVRGGSPYSRTAEQHRRVLAHIDRLCAWAKERSLDRLTLSEAARRVRDGRRERSHADAYRADESGGLSRT